jgi:hypothetical protein
MRTFLALFFFALFVNLLFASLTYLLFRGQIRGANTFVDYFYYSIGHLTTAGTTGMEPATTGVRLWTSMYVLVVWVYVFYVAVNHIRNIRIGGMG